MVKRGDWVQWQGQPTWRGFVRRVARDGSWADVAWHDGWSKRVAASNLEVLHTISLGGGWEVTDMTRKRELERECINLREPGSAPGEA